MPGSLLPAPPGEGPTLEMLSDVYAAFHHAEIPIFIIDREGFIVDANATFAGTYTRTHPRCIGANLFEELASRPVDSPFTEKVTRSIRELFESGRPAVAQEVVAETCYWIGLYPILSREGQAEKCFIVAQDITVQQHLAEQQKEQEAHWGITSESCRLGLWKLDMKTMSLQATPELDRIYGYPPNTLRWDLPTFFSQIIPEDRPRVESFVRGCLDTETDGSFECRIMRANGEIRHLSISGKMQFDAHDRGISIYGFTQDITEQKLREEAYEEEQLQWEQTARQCNMSIWKLDLETGRVTHKPENAGLFGKGSDDVEWTASTFIERIVPEDRQRVTEIYERSLRTHQDVNYDCRVLHDDSKVRWLNVFGTYQFDGEGKATSVVGAVTDITDRKLLQLEVDAIQEQRQHSQKMELLGQLAGGIAHDVNNVLAAIQGNTELVLKELPPNDPHRKNLESVTHSVTRSAEMVRQLLAFARKQPIRPVEVGADAELERMYLLLRTLIREEVILRWQLQCPHAFVKLDPSNLVQIVTNLCINARDAIDGHGIISLGSSVVSAKSCEELRKIALNPAGDYLRIRISDNGSGIDPQVLPHIFEPFFTTKGKGTGLGLSTVYGLVKQNEGHISCMSALGHGTTFDLFFPLVQRAAPARAEVPEEGAHPVFPAEATVLVVEDEPDLLAIVKVVLASEGFTVLAAANAEEALETARQHPNEIMLAITDILLPGMNGVQMSRELRQLNPLMKFLFISGYSADALGSYGNLSEEVNFISKPFSIIRFLTMVHTVLKP